MALSAWMHPVVICRALMTSTILLRHATARINTEQLDIRSRQDTGTKPSSSKLPLQVNFRRVCPCI